jgi:chromate reductase, NAD(P)H dehydrogenase (quinone)
VTGLKHRVEAANAVLIVTPEFNRSFPGVVNNALDWASRPYGQNSWTGKPLAMAGASPGGIGTAAAQSQLRAILPVLGFVTMGQPEVSTSTSK